MFHVKHYQEKQKYFNPDAMFHVKHIVKKP